MHLSKTSLIAATAVATLLGSLTLSPAVNAEAGAESALEKGKVVAFDRKRGNCLACHVMGDGPLPGNIGPPLVAMNARFPDQAKLRAQIWDATKKNPNTMMPPFGRHNILTEEEIDLVTKFVHSL